MLKTYIKNTLIILKKEHKFLSLAVIISFILGLIPCLFCIIGFDYDKLSGLFFLIPVFAIIIISLIAIKSYKHFPKTTTIITFLLNSFIIICVQIIFGFFVLCLFSMFDSDTPIDNPKYYEKAIKDISEKQRISHFPRRIPENAKDVELYKSTNSWFGSEAILIKYTIDKNVINKELKKYKYISIELPNNYQHCFDAMTTDNGRIKIDDFTFYVINDRDHENLAGHHFPYHYGIGVNKNKNQIIYYYTCPD